MDQKDLPVMICNDPECFCEDKCCQVCKDLPVCVNRCEAFSYKERICNDSSFHIEELIKLAEEQDHWLMIATVEILKDALIRAEAAENKLSLLQVALQIGAKSFAAGVKGVHSGNWDKWTQSVMDNWIKVAQLNLADKAKEARHD